jgi:methylglutaconyl-CoA hydratase
MSDTVLLEIQSSVAYVTLNRPELHNAFNQEMIAALGACFTELADRADIGVVVLKAAGKSFSAGADMNWMKASAQYSEEENHQDALNLARMLKSLFDLPQFSIALVQGAAMGGGMGLVSCCDLVIAEENTKFALSEVKLGLIPATIAPYVMRAIGQRQARRYFQSGEFIPAARAQSIGLIHEIVSGQDQFAIALAETLTIVGKNGTEAMRAAKTLATEISADDAINEALLDNTARRIAKTRSGAEAQEGLSAFLEKRKPSWIKT